MTKVSVYIPFQTYKLLKITYLETEYIMNCALTPRSDVSSAIFLVISLSHTFYCRIQLPKIMDLCMRGPLHHEWSPTSVNKWHSFL